MSKISGGAKIQDFGHSSSARKVPLTADKVEIGTKMAKISGGGKTPDILKKGRGPKNGQNSSWGKNIEKIREPKNGQNSIWGKTGHL